MVMDYQLIMVPAEELAENVNKALGEGWELHGAPFFVKEERDTTYGRTSIMTPWLAQAVTKSEAPMMSVETESFPHAPNFVPCQRHPGRPRRSTSCRLCKAEKARGEETAQDEQGSAEE